MINLTNFQKKVLGLVNKIPKGKITTYKILAQRLGKPKAGRAVGRALNKNPFMIIIPCHRVVRSDGGLGGYKDGLKKKNLLLAREGIEIKNNKIMNLKKFLISNI